MSELKFCRICINTGVKLYSADQFSLQCYYEDLIDMKESKNSINTFFCYECAVVLHKVKRFKDKCETGQRVLNYLLLQGPLTQETISSVNRKVNNLVSTLSILRPTLIISTPTKIIEESCHVINSQIDECHKDHEICDVFVKEEEVIQAACPEPIQYEFVDENVELKTDVQSNDDVKITDNSLTSTESAKAVNKTQSGKVPSKVKGHKREKIKFDPVKWKVVHLSKEEMLSEYNKQKDTQKTGFNCEFCYKNYICADTLKRHLKVHSKSLGKFECFLCKRRFKWLSKLRMHLNTHKVRYHCLKCFQVFNSRWVAVQHELMHEGINYQCKHCDAKFTKKSTYYTHMRELHRSQHICETCGESFLSPMGLNKHTLYKHPEDANVKSSSKSEVNEDGERSKDTYCEKCNISFKSLVAFDEHFDNSAMHIGDADKDRGLNAKPKLFKAATTLAQTSSQEEQYSCGQCDEKFFTSKAYERHMGMKHVERTDRQFRGLCNRGRYICEICGANLAATSMKMHQNMHKNKRYRSKKEFPCVTCGKVFKSAWNREQHLTTHTGEKPFSCKVCDKKFTQQQGVLKHFRRYH